MKNSRRDYTHDQALRLIEKMMQDERYQYQLQQVGQVDGLQTAVSLVQSSRQSHAYRGAGSGNLIEATIKSLYEAVEDLLCHEFANHADHEDVFMQSLSGSRDQEYLRAREMIPSIFSHQDICYQQMPWIRLKKAGEGVRALSYPLALVLPHLHRALPYHETEYLSEITRFANTTGIAIGATARESLLHGIYEWVERDAYGMFLLSTFIKNNPFHVINKSSLTDDITAQIELIESTFHDELLIVDLTTDMNIPSFFVSFTRQDVPQQPSGIGASLNKVDALTQALYEALQARDRYNANTVDARTAIINHYQQYPILQRAYQCDLLRLHELNRFTDRNWNDVQSIKIPDQINDQIKMLINVFQQHDCEIYFNHLYQHDTGITLTYVLAVGVETFGMMREGVFSPVKQRGMRYLSKDNSI